MKRYEHWPPNEEAILESIRQSFQSGQWWHSQGAAVRELETRFARMHDARFGLATCNATLALDVLLRGLGIGPGDNVVLPAYSFYSPVYNVVQAGATPVFVDVDPDTLTLDLDQLAALDLTDVKAVIAVHISGSVARLDRLAELCRAAQVQLIEDCAQAHGASYAGRGVGSWGVAGFFSFGGAKLMSSGQGGIITTSDEELYETCYAIVHRGRGVGGGVNRRGILGGNYMLADLAAAMLLPQLDVLNALCEQRARVIDFLEQTLPTIPGCSMLKPYPQVTCRAQYMYSFRYEAAGDDRDALLDRARQRQLPFIPGYNCLADEKRLFNQYAIDRSYPVARAAQTSVIGIFHPYLLHELDYWQDVVEAFAAMVQ
ncbi:MAG TPA: DegT/DnrJ/EryC1/StrS family aminotransferase [Herpetosiphonaceae bacterium]